MSTIQNTNHQNTNYLQITLLQKKLPTYQHEYPVLLRKSAPMFSFPGMSSTLKYSCTATAHRNTRSFWYDASFWALQGLMDRLECKSSSSQVKFEPLDTPHNR